MNVELLYVAAAMVLLAAVVVFGVLVLDITTVCETPADKRDVKVIVNTFVVAAIVVPEAAVQGLGLQVNPVNVITSVPPAGTAT